MLTVTPPFCIIRNLPTQHAILMRFAIKWSAAIRRRKGSDKVHPILARFGYWWLRLLRHPLPVTHTGLFRGCGICGYVPHTLRRFCQIHFCCPTHSLFRRRIIGSQQKNNQQTRSLAIPVGVLLAELARLKPGITPKSFLFISRLHGLHIVDFYLYDFKLQFPQLDVGDY